MKRPTTATKRPVSTAKRERPAWNDGFSSKADEYRISRAELLQKKLAYVSKNKAVAKEEWNRN